MSKALCKGHSARGTMRSSSSAGRPLLCSADEPRGEGKGRRGL